MSQSAASEENHASVSTSVWTLLRLRWMIFLIGFKRASRFRKMITIAILLLLLAGIGFITRLSRYVLELLSDPGFVAMVGDLDQVLATLPNILLTGAFVGILVTSFGLLLQALYLAGDMDFLLSRPVPIRAVFISKLLQAVVPNFCLISFFLLPVLFGLGLAQKYSLYFYPLVLLELSVLALAAAGISSLLVMVIARFFPPRRVAEIIGFFAATVSFLCSQSGQLARWENFSSQDFNQVTFLLQQFDTPFSPLYWAGQGLISIGQGEWLSGIGLVASTVLTAGLVFSLSLVAAENLYYSGWANMQARVKKGRRFRREEFRSQIPRLKLFERIFYTPVWAITIKDWTVLRRDIRNLSQLITPLIFGIIYAATFLRAGNQLPAGRGEAPEWLMNGMETFVGYAHVGLSLFVGWMLLGRLAGMAFSQEGRNYWLLKTSPVKAVELIWAKFLVSYLPVLALGWGFLVILQFIQGYPLGMQIFSLTVVAFSTAGNTGINLAFGVTGAKLDWEDPRQMQRGSTSCLGALVSMIYLGGSFLIFFGIPLLIEFLGLSRAIGQVLGLTLGIPYSLAFTLLPLWLVRNRLANLGEL